MYLKFDAINLIKMEVGTLRGLVIESKRRFFYDGGILVYKDFYEVRSLSF